MHRLKYGDNNGESCGVCGVTLRGYGYSGVSKECVHVWEKISSGIDAPPGMQVLVCTYCEVIKIESGEVKV
jgi:hypothetical protein